MPLSSNLIKERAIELGFDVVGITAAQPARHGGEFKQWLDAGHHADMDWIAKGVEKRVDPRVLWPKAKSMIVVGVSYYTAPPPPEIWNDPMRGRIARYAWGRDYHKVIPKRLKALSQFLMEEGGADLEIQAFNDTRPMLEHDAALAAGLGFIGRNSLLIHPDWGSMLFLGGLLVSCELESDAPTPDSGAEQETPDGRTASCGNCRLCLLTCPTHAFPSEYVLNSRLCISYQTIENRGQIPEELRPKMGNWIFGCDVCQEVCPWVKRYGRPSHAAWLESDPDRMAPRLDELVDLDDEGFLQRFAGTPIMRTKRRGLLRNVAVALGNAGTPEAIPLLEKLADDADELVRSHARWGLA